MLYTGLDLHKSFSYITTMNDKGQIVGQKNLHIGTDYQQTTRSRNTLRPGVTIGEASRKIGVTEQTYYHWRKEYGGMRVEQAKRLKELEKDEGGELVGRIVELATQYGRYGYRRTTALLNQEGWLVNHKRVERIWRREGLKVPQKQPKQGRLWLNDGSCIRLRPSHQLTGCYRPAVSIVCFSRHSGTHSVR